MPSPTLQSTHHKLWGKKLRNIVLDKSTGECLHDFEVSKDFLRRIQKALNPVGKKKINQPTFRSSIHQRASLVAQTVMRLPSMQKTWVQSLGWEDPLEKEMAAQSSTLAWKIP